MKLAISMACLSCTFVLAAFGCASDDGGSAQPAPVENGTTDQELRGRNRPRPPRGGPVDPGAASCAAVLCPVNTTCEVVDGSARCVPSENPCNLIDCRSGDVCELQNGEPVCVPADPGASACAAVLCPVNSTCEVIDGSAVCVRAPGTFCGGFGGFQCNGSAQCVDDPSDDCDPNNGGADCGGVCVCNNLALCAPGFIFDETPGVCECVADVPAECAAVTCLEGSQCVVVDGRAECVANEAPECAAVLCLEGTQCVVVDGRAECIAIEQPECAAVLCIEGTHCEVRRGRARCVDNHECRGGRH